MRVEKHARDRERRDKKIKSLKEVLGDFRMQALSVKGVGSSVAQKGEYRRGIEKKIRWRVEEEKARRGTLVHDENDPQRAFSALELLPSRSGTRMVKNWRCGNQEMDES